ncbi:SoxR reducing system RseC family protein [Candidatus Poribacteria bacterium]
MELTHVGSIREEGVVTEVHGHMATVRIDKAGACARCKVGCMEQGGGMVTEAANPTGAQVGDTVQLAFNPRAALTASLITFGVPLLALLLGVILASVVADQIDYQGSRQLVSIGTGAILFVLSFIPLRAYDRRIKEGGTYNVVVLEVLEHPK